MGNALSTAGVAVYGGIEKTKGAKPTNLSDYTRITDIKEVPELNPEPSTLDSTTLDETEFKKYIPGLKDLGGAISFTANHTEELQTTWDAHVEAVKAAEAEGKSAWYCIVHPKLSKAVYFKGEPSKMGMPSMGVDSVMETNIYIVPTSAPEWDVKPTTT